MYSQTQKFADSVFSFLSKPMNSAIAGEWQKRHTDFRVDWNLYGISAIHQFCPKVNCLQKSQIRSPEANPVDFSCVYYVPFRALLHYVHEFIITLYLITLYP